MSALLEEVLATFKTPILAKIDDNDKPIHGDDVGELCNKMKNKAKATMIKLTYSMVKYGHLSAIIKQVGYKNGVGKK